MRQRSSGPGGVERETGRNRGRENITRIYYVRGRKCLFSIKGGSGKQKMDVYSLWPHRGERQGDAMSATLPAHSPTPGS